MDASPIRCFLRVCHVVCLPFGTALHRFCTVPRQTETRSTTAALVRAARRTLRAHHLIQSPACSTAIPASATRGRCATSSTWPTPTHAGTAASPDLIQFATGGGTIAVGSLTAGAALPALAAMKWPSSTRPPPPATTARRSSPWMAPTPRRRPDRRTDHQWRFEHGQGPRHRPFLGQRPPAGHQRRATPILASSIGITPAGAAAGNGLNGIFIDDSSGNIIGGEATGAANVISGNGGDGILDHRQALSTTWSSPTSSAPTRRVPPPSATARTASRSPTARG